jgi:hypothetical protein
MSALPLLAGRWRLPTTEWEIDNAPLVDDLGHRGVLGFHHGSVGGHHHFLLDGAHLQRDINLDIVAYVQDDAGTNLIAE